MGTSNQMGYAIDCTSDAVLFSRRFNIHQAPFPHPNPLLAPPSPPAMPDNRPYPAAPPAPTPPKQAQHSARRLARVRGGAACRTHTPLVRLGALVVCVGAACHFQPRCAALIPATEIPVPHAARQRPPRPPQRFGAGCGGTRRCHGVWCAAADPSGRVNTAQRENQQRARRAICAPPSHPGLAVVVLKIDHKGSTKVLYDGWKRAPTPDLPPHGLGWGAGATTHALGRVVVRPRHIDFSLVAAVKWAQTPSPSTPPAGRRATTTW